MSDLEEFRKRKDEFFQQNRQSPLFPEQKRRFTGLAYFPENPDLVIETELAEPEDKSELTMETSTGDRQTYRRAGVVHFTVDGQPAQLTLYESDPNAELFVPFRDATSGHESYGAGRYLEVKRPEHGRVVVDFNYAYNPYCAYNSRWSCPLPPIENWLKVPIRAGEKDYPDKPGGH